MGEQNEDQAKKKSTALGAGDKAVRDVREDTVRKSSVGSLKIVLIFSLLECWKLQGVEVKEYEDPLNLEVISNKII